MGVVTLAGREARRILPSFRRETDIRSPQDE